MRKSVLLAIILLSVGCATQPVERANVPAQGRIGIVNLVSDKLTHTHVGTTAFNNFRKQYSVPWSPAGFLRDATVEQLTQSRNVTIVNLEPTSALNAYEGSFHTPTWSSFKLDESIAAELQSIAEQGDVDLLIVLREGTQSDTVTGTNQSFRGYGLYTRSFAGIDRAFVYVSTPPVVIAPSPARLVSGSSGFVAVGGGKPRPLPDGTFPADHKNLSESDLKAIEEPLKQLLLDWAKFAAKEAGAQ